MTSSATRQWQVRPALLPPTQSQTKLQTQSQSQPQIQSHHKSPITCPIPIKDRSRVNGLAMQDGSFLSIDHLHHSLLSDRVGDQSQSHGDLLQASSWRHSTSDYSPGSVLPNQGERYGALHLSPGSQMIGSDASNLADDQNCFENTYPLDFEFDSELQTPLSPDQAYLVTGAGGPASFDPDDTLLDRVNLGPGLISPRLQPSDTFIDAELAASLEAEKVDEIRNMSAMQVYRLTFGRESRFESPMTSGSSFPSLDSALTSSYNQSFPTPDRYPLHSPSPSTRNPLEGSSPILPSLANIGGQEQRRRASSLTQRQRSRTSSNNSANPNGPRKAARKGPLLAETRERAGKMRAKKACAFCHAHKRACALETPCPGCIQQYGNDVVNHPCRDSLPECITHVAMHNDAKWFPHGRSLGDFNLFPTNMVTERYTIPVVTAFGPPMELQVYVFDISNEDAIRHRHVVQTPEHRARENLSYLCDDLVLPVALSNADSLAADISRHVTTLVEDHFQDFSWYKDKFNALEMVYSLYLHYRNNGYRRYATLLQKSLRLLCLIHACDISVSTDNHAVREIYMKHIWSKFKPDNRENAGLTACYLRAEFGRVIPDLARTLMTEVIQSLLQIYAEDGTDRLPVVVSVNVLLMMTLESIMSRGARIPYHLLLSKGSLSSPSAPKSDSPTLDFAAYTPNYTSLHNGEACARALIKRYRATFGPKHDAYFSPDTQNDHHDSKFVTAMGTAPTEFIERMSALVHAASPYLEHKRTTPCTPQPDDPANDISQVFDYLTARFFLDRD